MLFNCDDIIKVKVRFEDSKEWRWFDFGYLHCGDTFYHDILGCVRGNCIEVCGGFDDGHYEITFPVRRQKLKDFKKQINTFNQYYPIFSKNPEWGSKFYKGS